MILFILDELNEHHNYDIRLLRAQEKNERLLTFFFLELLVELRVI